MRTLNEAFELAWKDPSFGMSQERQTRKYQLALERLQKRFDKVPQFKNIQKRIQHIKSFDKYQGTCLGGCFDCCCPSPFDSTYFTRLNNKLNKYWTHWKRKAHLEFAPCAWTKPEGS